jgi:IS5 family transposase
VSVRPWIGVDLDGTLAHYDGWHGVEHVGEPVPLMLARVRRWLTEGRYDVRIFTARVCPGNPGGLHEKARAAIEAWCELHFGIRLSVTCEKDMMMLQFWDDRAVQVEANTGRRADGMPG